MSDKKFKKIPKGENGSGKVSKVSKMIKNDMSDLRNVEAITAKQKLKLRCKCQHIDENGKTMLFRSENQRSDITGNPLFVCRLCGSYLDINELTEEDLKVAVDTVSRASDVIKMRLRPNLSEDDEAKYKKTWKLQYMMKSGEFTDLFKAARRRNKNNKRSNGGGDFISGRPMSH